MNKDRDALRISKEGFNSEDSTFGIGKERSSCFDKTTDR